MEFVVGHSDAFFCNGCVAKKGDLSGEPFALGRFQTERVLFKSLQDFVYVLLVFMFRVGEDDDIIKVSEAEYFEEGGKDSVDEALEYAGGGCQAHGHDLVFKESEEGLESSFSFAAFLHSEIGEARSYVEFGKDLGAGKS